MMFKSILAILAGYIADLLIIIVFTILAVLIIPTDSVVFTVILLLISTILASAIAGYLTAFIADRLFIRHSLILGCVIVFLNAVVIGVTYDDELPYLFNLFVTLLALPGTWLGGYYRYRQVKAYDLPESIPDDDESPAQF